MNAKEVFIAKTEKRGRAKVLRIAKAFPLSKLLNLVGYEVEALTLRGVEDGQTQQVTAKPEETTVIIAEIVSTMGRRKSVALVHGNVVSYLTPTLNGWRPALLNDGSRVVEPSWIVGAFNEPNAQELISTDATTKQEPKAIPVDEFAD
ncbi:MAG: hypothetical protein KatS3mg023_3851 [Armatimonadota bacterium]|nr:MAG: hypothetical protein KatS3mg023_2249 [Armatimonadota bacterium]GIV22100.1 MAG: hypothetical protein KatS3mg023_3851 [Armatimonadota bacterium]